MSELGKKKLRKLNLNDEVFVEFTQRGKKIYREYEDRRNNLAQLVFPNMDFLGRERKDLTGKLKFQLWELFSIFGNSIRLGEKSVFVNNIFKFELK